MDWTILPAPNPRAFAYELNTYVDTWHRFLESVDAPTQDERFQKAHRSGCFENIELDMDGLDGITRVQLTLTPKGIREACEAHENKQRVSISTCLPQSLKGLSKEELSRKLLESDEEMQEFERAIQNTRQPYEWTGVKYPTSHYFNDTIHVTF